MSDFLESAVEELIKGLLEVIITIKEFGEHVEKLQGTLKAILPRIEDVKHLGDKVPDTTHVTLEHLESLLKHGMEIVKKCAKISGWNLLDRYIYCKKITHLDEDLRKYAGLETQVDMWADVKLVLKNQKEISQRLESIEAVARIQVNVLKESTSVPELPSKVVGLSVPLEELKGILFCDDISLVSICGPGGCGKTTLASMLCKDDQVKARFKQIIYLTVSSKPNLLEIFRRLWVRLTGSAAAPGFINDIDAIIQTKNALKAGVTEPTLLVLDDVWTQKVLDNFLFKDVGNIKTLVTSRVRFTDLDFTYELGMLNDADAKTLFSHYAFNQDQAEEQEPEFVQQIVEGCKGFPLVLMVIASSLRNKPARTWRSTARKLKEREPFLDVHVDILHCLAASLDSLSNKDRECFVDLGCFPEDRKIPASSLIDIWAELYNFNEDQSYEVLLDLSNRSLISLFERTGNDAGGLEGNLSDLYIILHDLLRDLAIHVNAREKKRLVINQKKDDLPKSWTKSYDRTFPTLIVSIHTGEMSSLSWEGMSFPFAETKVLILHFSSKYYCLPTFLEKMEQLKALIVVNYDTSPAELVGLPPPSSLSKLKRIRLEKMLLPVVSTYNHEPFKALENLALVSCEVTEPDESLAFNIPTVFPSLRKLEINYCNRLEELPPGLCNVTTLEELNITNCPDLNALPNEIGNLTNLERLRLQACTSLEALPDSICKLRSLKYLDLSHCSEIEEMPEDFGELHHLHDIDMHGCLLIECLPESVKKLAGLKKAICDEATSSLWDVVQLEGLQIRVPKVKMDLNWLQ